MKIEYAYHIKVDGEVIFIGGDIQVQYANGTIRTGKLEQIGPSGVYIKFPGTKNTQFINYKKIKNIQEV